MDLKVDAVEHELAVVSLSGLNDLSPAYIIREKGVIFTRRYIYDILVKV